MSLINKLPSFYENNITKPIQNSLDIEVNSVNETLEELLNQFFLDGATYGLDSWEKMLGISKNNFDYTTRRENIKAKMRSKGTTTISFIKNICEAYSNGIVDIIVDHENFVFTIDFVGSLGVPKAFAEMDKAIEEVKPCHLEHKYKFNYNTHSDISNYTYEQLANYTHEEIRNLEELRGGK